ncbi:MAG TPA: UTP--glucose-1-phosphate uridylyltransferase [Solirubrobacteraceae bacterium]|jgi:UTP--glucose-1-phosphate uridylyltransferase|nr:UTP--glucose-1-phosphate uridylyltransferase [Solirubrobacteraceae bacterium]
MSEEGLRAASEKMRADGVADAAIDVFAHYYRELEAGATGMLPEADIEPVADLPRADDLPDPPDGGKEALGRTVMIKLNGGLGTSMGMTRAKSLLEVKDGLTFLDIVVRQTQQLGVPLALMNSFATSEDTKRFLRERYPDADVRELLQNKEPKLLVDDLVPAEWPADPELEWAPPGHGDIYVALQASGMLRSLLDGGYEAAFVSNSDNLGAVLDPKLAAAFLDSGAPFLMEVVPRTKADRKGGHLARRREDGRFVLRETAQTPEEDREALQDVGRHRYGNTNNLWVNLVALDRVLRERSGVLGLPVIVNRKTVDPSDESSPEVFQLETAMGAAIEVFEGAEAIEVSRTRFAPVKTTNDLLVLRSDFYTLTEDVHVVPADGREPGSIFVDLDPDHYKLLRDFDARFPAGPPSLVRASRFVVRGDVTFGPDVAVEGETELESG